MKPKILAGLILASLAWGQSPMIHQGVFLSDITSLLPPEILSGGRVLEVASNGKETVLLVQIGTVATIYRQTGESGKFIPLISDNDPRIKGKFVYRLWQGSRFDWTNLELNSSGLGFKACEDFGICSAYYISNNSNTVEPLALAGEAVKATNSLLPIKIGSASSPYLSADGKRKFLHLDTVGQGGFYAQDGIYIVEDSKYTLLLRTDVPTPFSIIEPFGIWEGKDGRLWFRENRYNSQTQASEHYLAAFNPVTQKKETLYKEGDPILGERVQSLTYGFDTIAREVFCLAGFYDSVKQQWTERLLNLDLLAPPDQTFKTLFRISNQPNASFLAGISKYMAMIFSWTNQERNKMVANLWNGGENLSPLLKEGERLPNGNQIGQLRYTPPSTFFAWINFLTTVTGCKGTIFTFNPDGTVQYWLRLSIPCILQAPTTAKAGERVTLSGENLTVGLPTLVEVLVNDIPVQPDSTGNDRITFTLPVNVTGKTAVFVRLTFPSGTVQSNRITINVVAPPIPIPEIRRVVSQNPGGVYPGELIRLEGENFATGEVKAFVQMADGRNLTPLSFSENYLEFQVPEDLPAVGDFWIRIQREDGVSSSWVRLVLITPPPTIKALANANYPEISGFHPGDIVKIQGRGFALPGSQNPPVVQMADGRNLTPLSFSENYLEFQVPEDLPAVGDFWIRIQREDGVSSSWVRLVLVPFQSETQEVPLGTSRF